MASGFHLAIAAVLCGVMACIAGPAVQSNAPVSHPAMTGTASSTPPASEATALPSPLVILDTYPSLATVRQRLEEMVFFSKADNQTMISGRQFLERFLVERQYNPAESNQAKQSVFSELDEYAWPYAGAKIFLINVATGLFAEAHGFYPWSLRDYSAREINNLFIQDGTFNWEESGMDRGDLPPEMPNTKFHAYALPDGIVADAHYKQFSLARRLTQGAATPEDAVHRIMTWMLQNFFHAYAPGYGWEVYLDGREPLTGGGPVAFPRTIERIYEERVSGCHEPVVLMEGMLHSLNIPALRLSMQGHGVLYLPTLDRYIHGDHLVGYHDAPAEKILLTPEEIRPFAEDAGKIYAIVYPDKYVSPFLSMPLYRDETSLFFSMENVRDFAAGTCIPVSEADWNRVSQQLSAYNLKYDTTNCILSSDRVPILTLDELTSPAP